jgi:FtsZ-binding cell division protein ZapB
MSNIYQISQELLSIFDEIEENGGELTPELEKALEVNRASFASKVKDYTNVIKMMQTDIAAIKDEKARLSDLQKSKEKTIERLKKVLMQAIEQFGDDSKNGSKFVDFGTGKVFVRNTQVVEVDEDATNRFVNRFMAALSWYNMANQLDQSIVDYNEILDYCNTKTEDEENDDVEITKFTEEDLEKLTASINVEADIHNLLRSPRGFNLLKALVEYHSFKVESKVNKTDIKREAKETNTLPSFAKFATSKSVTIK